MKHGRKLTNNQVRLCEKLYLRGLSMRKIAPLLGVSYQTVANVLIGKCYRWAPTSKGTRELIRIQRATNCRNDLYKRHSD